ncbi:MAG: sigma-70 family RNA polymerase sigma factor [Actinomycetota bacterium]
MRDPDLEAQTDELLVAAFVESKDERALEVLLARHESRVFGIAYRILGNRADALDATQDVFLTVFRKAGSFRGQAAFTTWLYRLTTNACHDIGRRKARTPLPMETLPNPPGAGSGEMDTRLGVEQALRALPQDQRVAIVMRDLYDLDYEQIAAATGVPLGTVKSRIARARRALAGIMDDSRGMEPRSGGGRLRKQR